MAKKAIIIGAGPAGLTAGLELLRRSDIVPVILEASDEIGGISRTIRYKGNRMDIGGHRFFSKSDRVMQWWMDLMPPDATVAGSDPAAPVATTPNGTAAANPAPVEISYQGKKRVVTVPAHVHEEPPLRGLGPLLTEADAEAAEPQEDSAADRGRNHCRPRARQSRPGHAHPPPSQPHLLSAQVLRLPHHPHRQHHLATSASPA